MTKFNEAERKFVNRFLTFFVENDVDIHGIFYMEVKYIILLISCFESDEAYTISDIEVYAVDDYGTFKKNILAFLDDVKQFFSKHNSKHYYELTNEQQTAFRLMFF